MLFVLTSRREDFERGERDLCRLRLGERSLFRDGDRRRRLGERDLRRRSDERDLSLRLR